MTLTRSHDESLEHLKNAHARLEKRSAMPLADAGDGDGSTVLSWVSCWTIDGTPSFRYGQLMVDGDYDLAHRWAWRIFIGPIPAGRQVRHTCGTDRCWNPLHLMIPAVRKTNDPAVRAAAVATVTAKARERSPLDWDKVDHIRASNYSLAELATHYGVSTSTVWKIRKGLTWVRPEAEAVAA